MQILPILKNMELEIREVEEDLLLEKQQQESQQEQLQKKSWKKNLEKNLKL